MNWNICSRILGFCVLALLLPFEALGQQPDPQGGQRMLLSPGWNLIAVQVEPEDADPAASFGVDGVVFCALGVMMVRRKTGEFG